MLDIRHFPATCCHIDAAAYADDTPCRCRRLRYIIICLLRHTAAAMIRLLIMMPLPP